MSTSLFDLSGRTALVTGAGSGIGRRLAVGLAAAGADVSCLDLPRQRAELDRTSAEIAEHGRSARALEADVTDAESARSAVERHETELGPLEIAVNCAGVNGSAPAEEMSSAEWHRVVDTNLTGVFHSCQAEAAVMLPRQRGAVVNIASMSATIANRGLWQVHYNSSKAGVKHLTTSLAAEWARRGVRVNSISPGYVSTPMTSGPEWDEKRAQFSEQTPLARMATPDELVGPVVFLASPAASYCTGADLLVDGGFTGW